MSRSPAHLRTAAEAVRALADALAADFAGLDAHSGPATWEGPAATAHRGRAAVVAFDARVAAVGLRALADRLDERAAAVARVEAEVAHG
ncbi:hypothetical protein HC251_05725 [Iamia sp. SCSIO 61187]|uniref:hypothetical protein n=1 Tax=Iamia sp. SCSIO 61187 TaxID=2722752 RepID=UPI001C637F75|nr:hypothetical protein [Iamia sp. SCSIO 61187]QYG91984.1 hypothetical protein HC251_05725 [Iamia sp. SCSIO 61187]